MLNSATLPLKGFIQCTVHGDFSVLGEGTDEERAEAWLSINSDYCEIVDDTDQKNQVNQGMRVYELAARIIRVTMMVEAMRMCYSPIIKEQLDKEDFGLEFNPDEPEQYEADLDRVLIELKMEEIELSQIEAMQVDRDEHTEPKSNATEDFFDEILVEIYQHLFQAPAMNLEKIKEEMMTNAFARYVKSLKKFYAQPPKPVF